MKKISNLTYFGSFIVAMFCSLMQYNYNSKIYIDSIAIMILSSHFFYKNFRYFQCLCEDGISAKIKVEKSRFYNSPRLAVVYWTDSTTTRTAATIFTWGNSTFSIQLQTVSYIYTQNIVNVILFKTLAWRMFCRQTRTACSKHALCNQ
jgi:hypothetical protein